VIIKRLSSPSVTCKLQKVYILLANDAILQDAKDGIDECKYLGNPSNNSETWINKQHLAKKASVFLL
jgi:hypothetical protein